MNHKSFVFFDCECANTFDGVGKICSLGYVICDDDLNIIESEDVVMNPECDFDWYLLSGKGDCARCQGVRWVLFQIHHTPDCKEN